MASPFETMVRLHMDNMTGPAARKYHIRRARAGLAEFMARQTVKPMVRLEVDGRPAASEDAVKPFGLIVYYFDRMREIVSFALRELERLSPVLSGAYRKAWLTLVDRAVVGLDNLVGARTVTIVNPLPYARKVHTGAKGFEVPAGIIEKVRQLTLKRYRRVVTVNIQFIDLDPGYKLRKPPRAGQRLTYPALVIEAL
jgi:hypothetical protein